MSRCNPFPHSITMDAGQKYELSSGDASTDGTGDCLKPGAYCLRKLPPRVVELPSTSFRSISRRNLFDNSDLPDLDETESSSVGTLFDERKDYDERAQGKIEVTDGVFMRLRGSAETQAAWDNGECIRTMCFVCDIPLACVSDCDCVICPHCRMVSPVDYVPKAAGFSRPHIGGVGLGIQL